MSDYTLTHYPAVFMSECLQLEWFIIMWRKFIIKVLEEESVVPTVYTCRLACLNLGCYSLVNLLHAF